VRLLAVAVALALPKSGALVPWRSLGGVGLGMTSAQVQRRWGLSHGRCRDCKQTTWYFNYAPFSPEGAAVRFRNGKVDAVWTLWKPEGWHLGPIVLDAPASSLTGQWTALVTIDCGSYEARILSKRGVTTVIYVYTDKVWGFGLNRQGGSPCH
jgi:hypothetical protein